ncbi:MAG: hypothetical protein FJ298_03435 [Planctomycetes bacterium]|nr:hypothetical protein [Planctomycetota bacterium]
MTYLLHIVVALALVMAAVEGLALDVCQPWGVGALAFAPHALGWLVRRLGVAGRFAMAGWILLALRHCALGCFALATLALGWSESVAEWSGTRLDLWSWPGLEILLVLVPFFAYTLLAIDARARLLDRRPQQLADLRRLELRSLFASALPFALMIAATAALGLYEPLRVQVEYVGLWSALFAVVVLAALAWLLPWLLRRAWNTSPMPEGRARSTLESHAARVGFRCGELVVWHTGFQQSNAAVVGIGPSRAVLFSDLLLAQLGERELEAVFAHEIGHVVRHHVLVFAAWTLAFLLGADLLFDALGFGDSVEGLALLGAALLLWYFVFGWFSRRVELEADWHALETMGDPQALISALERVGGTHGRVRDSWRHFSTARRMEFLRGAASDPSIGRRLARRLRNFGLVGGVAMVLVLAAQARELVLAYPRDQVSASLATGQYARAASWAREIPDLEPELTVLVSRALSTGECAPSTERLVQLARAAVERGVRIEALEYFTLAYLRGERSVGPELDALEADLKTGSR